MTAVDSEDGVAIEVPGSLTLDADFLLGQDLEFGDPDHDSKLLGLEKFSGLESTFFFIYKYTLKVLTLKMLVD